MSARNVLHSWWARIGFGLVMGAIIAAVDNIAFEGEVSPIIIVAMLLAATVAAGATWGSGGWLASVALWVCVPGPHLVKHVLGLPDTLHPNTYMSIFMQAAFTFVVAAIGTGCGMLARTGLASDDVRHS